MVSIESIPNYKKVEAVGDITPALLALYRLRLVKFKDALVEYSPILEGVVQMSMYGNKCPICKQKLSPINAKDVARLVKQEVCVSFLESIMMLLEIIGRGERK